MLQSWSVNKPKICFRGPKMNDKNLRQNVTQTSLFGNKINLFWKMRHFRPFSHSWILKEFEGFYDIKIKCLIFNKVVCGFFISIRISVSSVKWSVGFLSLKKRKLLIMQLLYEFNYSWHYLILSLIVSYLIVLSHKFGPLLCNISDGWILNVLHK